MPDALFAGQPARVPLGSAALFLTATVGPGREGTVREVLPGVAGLQRAVGFRAPRGGLATVVGVGSDAWDRLFSGPRPAELHPFLAVSGPVHRAPATPGDLLFHIRARRMDLCVEMAAQLLRQLGDAVTVVDEVQGFTYFDERDLLGFVDGTENPEGSEAARAALVGSEDPVFAGGSYVIVQKYLHDLAGWEALPVEQQERAVGRTKLSDIELPDGRKPADSHVALTSVNDPGSGDPWQIVRMNMPFASLKERQFGTYFIGYARTPRVTELMLEQMFLGADRDGRHDRLLDFSTAMTGCLFFAPPAGWDFTAG